MKRRSFGSIRRLRQVDIRPATKILYRQRRAAKQRLRESTTQRRGSRGRDEISGGSWINPDAGLVSMAEFGARWITNGRTSAPGLSNVQGLFRRHVLLASGTFAWGDHAATGVVAA